LLHISDIMHKDEGIPVVHEDAMLSAALMEMSKKGLGMTAVVDKENRLAGIFTDGDLRRTIDRKVDIHSARITDGMSRGCKTARPDMLAAKALQIMDENKINGLLILDTEDKLVGAINMHDLLRAGVV
jgi:arabinose-5-phosphate isomerase